VAQKILYFVNFTVIVFQNLKVMNKNRIGRIFLISFGVIMTLAGVASIYFLIIDPFKKVNLDTISDSVLFFIVGPALIYIGNSWKNKDFTKEN
jgi:hypothetical protein